MKVLIIGGTGAIGKYLVNILDSKGLQCVVTTRKERQNIGNVNYVKGNALNNEFLEVLLESRWDVIIDFMIYTEEIFSQRINKFLSKTEQYIYLSSSRVYSNSNELLKETSLRLLDSCKDAELINSNEYSLEKAKGEDLLLKSGMNNWTIVRPYLTYSVDRLQLGSLEKEAWIYRILHGRSLVFSKDIANTFTTLTYGYDVANCIARLVGNKLAFGEIIHIATDEYHTWNEILNIYLNVINKKTGRNVKIFKTDRTPYSFFLHTKYDRLYNRRFDNKKLKHIIGDIEFISAEKGLSMCLEEFLKNPIFNKIDWKKEATYDKITGERTLLSEIPSLKDKFIYLLIRYFVSFETLSKVSHIFKNK